MIVDIVKNLSPAARRAVLWLSEDGREKHADYTLRGIPGSKPLSAIVEAGLATMKERLGYPRGKYYAITDLGQRVRVALVTGDSSEPSAPANADMVPSQ